MPNLNAIQPYALDITLGTAIIAIICIILAIIALTSAGNLRRRLSAWKEISSSSDLEQVFAETKHGVRELEHELESTRAHIAHLEELLQRKVSTPVMQRYNAFAEVGSDLSFSVALVDDAGDGVVLTSIYGREDSVTYGKPVVAGDSSYQLTEEEQMVISQSMGKTRPQPAHMTF